MAASCSLAMEGATVEDTFSFQMLSPSSQYFSAAVPILNDQVADHPATRVCLGFAFGIIFILGTQWVLDRFDGDQVKMDVITGMAALDVRKMFLIIFVMTLHSMSEGIGIGVSFGGDHGKYISLSLAIHNVPEGLAVALTLCSRNVSKLRAALWAIFTSLPQPIMAIPAFIFVESFRLFLPVGLGFASGAMAYVAVFELLADAVTSLGVVPMSAVGALAFTAMLAATSVLEEAEL